jgi:hypothetical protein
MAIVTETAAILCIKLFYAGKMALSFKPNVKNNYRHKMAENTGSKNANLLPVF